MLKRRAGKQRTDYPETIERLLAGEPVEPSATARSDLLGLVYFGDWPELAEAVRERAEAIMRDWPDEMSC